MSEWVVGTLLVFVPFAAVVWLAMRWNLSLSEKLLHETLAEMGRQTQEGIARIDRLAAEATADIEADLPTGPNLAVTFHLKPGADPDRLAADSVQLYDALSRYERELGGQGLTLVGVNPVAAEPNRWRIEFAPVDTVGARERLEQVAAAVAGAKANGGPPPVVPSMFGERGAAFDALSAAVTSGVGA